MSLYFGKLGITKLKKKGVYDTNKQQKGILTNDFIIN